MISGDVPTVGYFPRSFPRDPVDVNIYLEHLLLGQVLEPLVECSQDGIISSAVAESWRCNDTFTSFELVVRSGLVFSNGTPVTAEDVKFTLERHANHGVSQSHHVLQNVASITLTSAQELLIRLRRPYPAFLKALSRDQLGIVPAGWCFDGSSEEPFVGTGVYRAFRCEEGWVLLKNARYRDASSVEVETWRLLFEPANNCWGASETADLVPFVMKDLGSEIAATKDGGVLTPFSEPALSFFQSSVWLNPYGNAFHSDAKRNLGAKLISELVKRVIARNGLVPATGIIPEGIVGCLSDSPEVEYDLGERLDDRDFCIAATHRDLAVLNSPEDIAEFEREFLVRIRLQQITPLTRHLLKENPAPDFVALSFAGAFADPEGFLVVIPSFLQAECAAVFRGCGALYEKAQQAIGEKNRRDLYEELGRTLIQEKVFVPGWKHPAVKFCKPGLKAKRDNVRHVMRLKNYFLG